MIFANQRSSILSGAAQGDGAGGDWQIFQRRLHGPTPHYWTTRRLSSFFQCAPDSRKDGTLAKIQTNSPPPPCLAKTGTFGSEDRLNG